MEEEGGATLSESELLRTLVNKTSSMVAYWGADLRCRFANHAYQRWFGVAPEWLIGKHISELLGPALYELNAPHIEGALRGEAQEFEREIPDPTGGPPRHSLASYLPDVAGGTVRGFFAMVTDISEVKRTQLAFKESEERFRLTLDEAPIGMALVALDGRFTRVNRALCEIVGYGPDELTGLTFQAITHPEDLNTDLALAKRLARGEIPRYQLEERYIRKDGTIVNVMLSGSLLRHGDGSPVHFIAQVEDISERKRIEKEQSFLAEVGPVLASSLDYSETLKSIAELAAREIADLCIVELVEEEAVRRLKVASRDPARIWLGELLAQLPLDRSRPHLMLSVLQTKRTVVLQDPTDEMLESFAQSEEHLRALRAAAIQSMVAVPLVAKERLLGVIALILSKGPRRYGPADVRLAEELARRASLAVENARLYELARRATQARDEVLGVVAHDLRTPLNNIVLQTTLLEVHGLLPEARCQKATKSISRAAQRMDRMIQDLLEVTRLEAGRLLVEAARVSTKVLLRDAIEGHENLASDASVELRLDAPASLPNIWADRGRLLQIFENLIGNAVKVSTSGGRITVGARPENGHVLFWVADTGSGIAAKDLPHLFDRFWQASEGQGGGAGLGLAIVKGLVEAHHGRIWVESQVGVGSTFYFTVPMASAARAPQS